MGLLVFVLHLSSFIRHHYHRHLLPSAMTASDEPFTKMVVLAIKCWIRVPASLRAVAKAKVVARRPVISLCPCWWLQRGLDIVSFRFDPDGWWESKDGASRDNVSSFSFIDLRKLATYYCEWPVEVKLQSKLGITRLRRPIVLRDLRGKIGRHLRQFADFDIMLYMDFTAEEFGIVVGVVTNTKVEHLSAAAAKEQDRAKRRRHWRRLKGSWKA